MREQPSSNAMLMTQALRGERVTVYDRNGEGWAWGQLSGDGYVGWLPDAALDEARGRADPYGQCATNLCLPRSLDQAAAGDTLVMGSKIAVAREDGGFAVTRDGQYLPKTHLAPLGHREPDFVAVAERFVGTPYLWGGKSSLGIDCSGLVQVSLTSAGIGCPRDSDMQQAGLGRALEPHERSSLLRGDLIFWKGHVAIVRDAEHHGSRQCASHGDGGRSRSSRRSHGSRQAGSEVIAIKRL